MPLLFKFGAQFGIVLDDAVMYHRQHAGAVGVRVRVLVVGAAMCGPACVADAERAWMGARVIFDGGFQVGDFPGAAAHVKVAGRGEYGYTGRVIAAIFEFAKSFEQYASDIGALWPDVA